MITVSGVFDAAALPGYLAFEREERLGLITFNIEGPACEIVTLDSLREGQGIGTALIDAVKRQAAASGCHRLWLITTNDNLHALRFYQKRGFRLAALHRDALQVWRLIKPEIPVIGMDGIPLRDAVELEMLLFHAEPGGARGA